MIDVFGMKLSKEELLERVSSMKQLGGARVFEYAEGKAAGVKAVKSMPEVLFLRFLRTEEWI